MKDEEYIARAIECCVVGNGSKQISLLVEELGRIVAEVKYVRSQSYCPDMGEFSRGYQTACDEILERCKPYRRIQAGRMTIEHLAKRLADVERWVEQRNGISENARLHNEANDSERKPCEHRVVQDQDAGAVCIKCSKDLGWYCQVSPKHFCEYADDECCVHCGAPEERQ